MTQKIKTDLKSLSADRLAAFMRELGLPRFRAKQLVHWIYEKNVSTVEEITEFSKDLRASLADAAYISNLVPVQTQQSADGTVKYLYSLEDGQCIESVLIPDRDRLTLCVSSQVGCAMGCRFCMTGRLGLTRSLSAHEIVDQIIAVNRSISPRRVTNIVLMGMGEPLANFREVIEALSRITAFTGISKRRITLSTAGIVPHIMLLPERAPEVNLAISLNATTDETRGRIMPVNKKYPLKTLIDACRKFPLSPRRRITFEYVLIEGVNDSDEDARRLVRLLRGIPCKVNLIPCNPFEGSPLKRPSEERVLKFQEILTRSHLTALIRDSRGQDIAAACGQLRGTGQIRDMG